jgi:hypothetical protein
MHEQRKWSIAKSKTLANGVENKVKKNSKKKKLSELYKRSMSLYVAINLNSDLCDLSMGCGGMKVSDGLNSHLKNISNLEYFSEQFNHWKNSISEIESTIQRKFGEKNMKKAENFLRVLTSMKKIISTQESNFNKINNGNMEDVKMSDLNSSYEINPIYSQPYSNRLKLDNINIDKIGKEFQSIIEDILKEIQTEEDLFLEESKNLDDNSNINNYINIDSASFNEDEIISKIKPRQLFYNNCNLSNNPEELKNYLEKSLNIENDKICILPQYDYKKIFGSIVDTNKNIDEYTKIFMKIFPPVYHIDNNYIGTEYLESEIDIYKSKNEKFEKEKSSNRLFNLKFEKFTLLQKLVLVWGLIYFGGNYHIISEIGNIFVFTKSLQYDPEEIYLMLDKILMEFNIDLIASSFESLNRPRTNSQLIYDFDSPIMNSNQCNFIYNEKLTNLIFKHSPLNTYPLNSNIVIKKNDDIRDQKNQKSMNFIVDSPILSQHKILQKSLKEELKKVCLRVEKNYENFLKNLESIDFPSMTRKKETHKSVLKKTSLNENKMQLGRNWDYSGDINIVGKNLKSLSNFSSCNLSDNILDNTKPNLRQETLEGVSFFSQQSIHKEWETLRTPWYQNNVQFKPKFRKPRK